MHVSRRLRLGIIACALLATGCQTRPPVASTVPPPGPASIAYVPGAAASAWTTPAEEPPATPAVRKPLGRHSPFELGSLEKDDPIAKALAKAGIGGSGDKPDDVDLEDLDTAGPWELSFTASSTFLLGGEFDNGDDGLDTWIHSLRVALSKPMPHFGRLGLSAAYTLYDFDFTGPNALFPGVTDPFDRAHALSVGLNVFQPVHEKVALILNASLGATAEVGAPLEDALAWSVSFGGGYRFSDEFDLGGGVFIADRFAEDLLFFGGPQFTWRPTERWRIALEGATLSATFTPNATWAWGVAGGFDSVRFRLREEAPGSSQIVTDSRLPIYFKLRFRGSETTDLELRLGMNVYRDFVLEDAQGNNGVGLGSDPAPYFALRWIQRL